MPHFGACRFCRQDRRHSCATAAVDPALPRERARRHEGAWPLAIVGSLGYIAGQLPTSIYLGPYLPDVLGSIVCFACLLVLLKFWRPAQTLGYGGVPVTAAQEAQAEGHGLSPGEVFQGWLPILILIAIVVAWTGPWSKLPSIVGLHLQVNAASSTRARSDHRGDVQLDAVRRRQRDPGIVDRRCAVVSDQRLAARQDLRHHLVADVGRFAGRSVHLRAGLRLQLLRHGWIARQGVFRRSGPTSSSSLQFSASSAWRFRAAILRPMPCSASSRPWSGSCSACR